MANEQAKQILQQGIAAARAGQQAQARQLLQEAVRRDPRSEAAWLWLSSVAKDNQERIFCLKQLLAINPNNENAIKGLKQLGVSTETATQTAPSTVPVVDERKLTASMQQLDPILQRYQPVPTRPLPFEWMKKKRGRVGDSSAALLRTAAVVAVLLVIGGIIGGGLFIAPRLGIGVSFLSTPTEVPTRRPTATATPGVTDTPSPIPRSSATPSYTPPPRVEAGSLISREPTPIYPNVTSGNAIRDAQALLTGGKYDDALKKLEDERKGLINVKGKDYDTVIYHMVLVYLAQDNTDRALAVLSDPENRSDSAIYQAAMSNVLFAQREYDRALSEATDAFRKDELLIDAFLVAARVYILRELYTDAIRVLRAGLEQQPGNVVLRTTLGNVQLLANDPKGAYDNALLALYVDPLDEDAFILRSKALLALAARMDNQEQRIQAFGTAVLATKEFLLYYPGETIAWLLLGQGRQGEENISAAIDAYTQAVVIDQQSPAAQQVFLNRGKLYLDQRRYEEAFADFDKANTIGATTEGHEGRLQAALALKNYGAASDDVNVLLRTTANDSRLLLTKVELSIRTGKFSDAASVLTDTFVNDLSGAARAEAQLYRSIVRFQSEDLQKALEDVNASLAARDSALGHYYRGQIYEALRRYKEALQDYEWLMFWDHVYKYEFMEDVTGRVEKIQALIPTVTPAPSPTIRVTSTPFPSRTPRPTATDTPTRTATPTPSDTPTRPPTRTPRGFRASPTPTETPTDTPTPSDTPTRTATPTRTPTETPTSDATSEATSAATQEGTD